eukprot:scaffold39930_cov18-Phaeocystis_antarctica.AAC.1
MLEVRPGSRAVATPATHAPTRSHGLAKFERGGNAERKFQNPCYCFFNPPEATLRTTAHPVYK